MVVGAVVRTRLTRVVLTGTAFVVGGPTGRLGGGRSHAAVVVGCRRSGRRWRPGRGGRRRELLALRSDRFRRREPQRRGRMARRPRVERGPHRGAAGDQTVCGDHADQAGARPRQVAPGAPRSFVAGCTGLQDDRPSAEVIWVVHESIVAHSAGRAPSDLGTSTQSYRRRRWAHRAAWVRSVTPNRW